MNFRKKLFYCLALICMSFALTKPLFCSEKKGKVALLFLTRNDVNFPTLWERLLHETTDQFTVYVHSKEPVHNSFFQERRIDKIVSTTWSIHCRAWQNLLQEALKSPDNQKFVFLSESCLPLYPLDHIYVHLMKDDQTHMAFSRPWWRPDSIRELHEINIIHRYGNNEWIVLNRKHAEIIANDRGIIRIISKYPNDQESYFATLLSIYGCLGEVINHSYTYSNWNYATNNGASPYHFEKDDALSQELLQDAYNIGALFIRKVSKNFPETILQQAIYQGLSYFLS